MADNNTRPLNGLLRSLKHSDFELLASSLLVVESAASETLYHPATPSTSSTFLEARLQSPELRRLFERYSDFFVAQQSQSGACNAAHSIEQRAAKWMLQILEHTGAEHVELTHEELAGLLGIGRSYFTRVIQVLKAEGILDAARGEIGS